MVLPEGFALPPVPYLLAITLSLIGVVGALYRRSVPFGGVHVLALLPWMVTGSALHVLYVLDSAPAVVAPLLGTPAVYASVAAVAGAVWLGVDTLDRSTPQGLGIVGVVAALGAVLSVGAVGLARNTLAVLPSLAALAIAVVVTGVAWWGLTRVRPAVSKIGWVGVVTLGAHALDGVSTAIGVDWLGFGERTPLSAAIIEFGADLPTAGVLGDAWLFVVVKLLVVAWIVSLFVEYVREEPAEGYGLLGVVTAVGLGPAAHNLLLFAVA
jgi:uncharacterized membrane protein